MTARRPLVRIAGVDQQLPVGDTLDAVLSQAPELQACYAGSLGPSAIRHFADAGFAFRAGNGALFPALSTTVVAAPRDPVFNGIADGTSFASNVANSPLSSSGTGAGASVTTAAQLVMTTGSTATGYTRMDFACRDTARYPFAVADVASINAEFYVTIPTLSVAAQAFSTRLFAGLIGITNSAPTIESNLAVELYQSSALYGGAWTARLVQLESSAPLATASGSAPTAGVEYRVQLSYPAPFMQATVTITNMTTQAVQTLTLDYPYEDPPLFTGALLYPRVFAQLTKSAGTTARTLQLREARGLILLN